MKCEDSNETSSEEEDDEASEATEFGEDLMAGDESIAPGGDPDEIAESELRAKRVKVHQKMIADLLAREETHLDFITDEDPKQLKYSTAISFKAKKAHYKTPDYCFITKASTLSILLLELDPLVDAGGILYGLYNEIKEIGDFEKKPQGENIIRVVIFFDDPKIDYMGEMLKVETRMKEFDVQLPFKNYASKLFQQFNARQ